MEMQCGMGQGYQTCQIKLPDLKKENGFNSFCSTLEGFLTISTTANCTTLPSYMLQDFWAFNETRGAPLSILLRHKFSNTGFALYENVPSRWVYPSNHILSDFANWFWEIISDMSELRSWISCFELYTRSTKTLNLKLLHTPCPPMAFSICLDIPRTNPGGRLFHSVSRDDWDLQTPTFSFIMDSENMSLNKTLLALHLIDCIDWIFLTKSCSMTWDFASIKDWFCNMCISYFGLGVELFLSLYQGLTLVYK